MNIPLLVAGALSLLAAAIHGIAGDVLVVRRLSPGALPPTRFGGPPMTHAMIRAAWHLTTMGFLTVGTALLLAGSVVEGETARGMALVAAGGASANAALVAGGTLARNPRSILRHPAPVLLTAVAALAWWGAA